MRKHVFRALTTATAVVSLFLFATLSDVTAAAGDTGSGNSAYNPSPEPWNPPEIVTVVGEMPDGWAQEPITEEGYNNAKAAAESSEAKQKIEEKMPGWTFDSVVDVWNFGWYKAEVEFGDVVVKMPPLPDRDNYTYVLLYYPITDWTDIKGFPEVILFRPVDLDNNYWAFEVAGRFRIVFVRLVSKSEPVPAPNPEPSETDWYTEKDIEVADGLPEGIQQNEITNEAHGLGTQAGKSDNAKAQVEEKLPGWTIDDVVSVFDLVVEKAGQVSVIMPTLSDSDNYTYVALHYRDWGFSGYPEVIKMTLTDWTNNKWTFDVTSGSPYVFVKLRKVAATNPGAGQLGQSASQVTAAQVTAVQAAATGDSPVSPKTGEAQPVATGIVILCLAGIAVCAKRVRQKS